MGEALNRYPVAALVVALMLTGCGGGTTPAAAPPATSATVSSTFNNADVMFAQMMIAHLQQGVDMAQVAKAKATRQEVKALAGAVDVTQRAELDSLRSWLRAWNKPEDTSHDPNMHAAHGGLPLLDEKTVSELKDLGGAEFEKTYLNLMTGHQHGAVEMARTEAKDGSNPEAKAMADRVVQSRTAQISQMLTLLG